MKHENWTVERSAKKKTQKTGSGYVRHKGSTPHDR